MRNKILILLIGVISCSGPAREKVTLPQQEQKTVASVKLADLNDQSISLDQFKGKTIFINFWATWCKPCIQEMSSIDSAQKLLSKNGIVFLLASEETPKQIKEFKEYYQFDLNFVRLTNMEELSMDGLPTTYIFNPKGELAFSETGYRKWNDTSNVGMILKINNQK
jgi:thiol-disulfide isomerase/thioredoxin